jgi:hypothetical protein
LDKWAKNREEWATKREEILAKATPYEIYRENLLRKKLGEPLVKDPNAPKKSKNGFMFYIEELRITGKADYSQGVAHHAKVAGEKWASMAESEKKVQYHAAILMRRSNHITQHAAIEIS